LCLEACRRERDPANPKNPIKYKGEPITKKDLRVPRKLQKSKLVDDSRNLATLGDVRGVKFPEDV
jgi:hypothetical protein